MKTSKEHQNEGEEGKQGEKGEHRNKDKIWETKGRKEQQKDGDSYRVQSHLYVIHLPFPP